MKRLSLLVAAAAAALALFAIPALAALPDDGPIAIERLDCTAPDLASADFAAAILSPAVEHVLLTPASVTCDAALLAETGLCLVEVEPARVSFAFAQPPDPVWGETIVPSCRIDRSPTG